MSELAFAGITKRFSGKAVLHGLSATLPLTGHTFIVGQSGSGKSVLCRLAVGLLRPDAGTVTLLGEPVHALPERALSRLRRKTPYLVQGPALLDWLTLRDNVALAAKRSLADGRAQAALEQVGLGAFGDRLPPQVGPGLKKRAAIARALVLSPMALLLDEPTTGLDSEAAAQVNDALLALKAAGVGAVIVSHDYRALERMADLVIEVKAGAIGYRGDSRGFLKARAELAQEQGKGGHNRNG